MTAITQQQTSAIQRESRSATMPFLLQLSTMSWRSLKVTFRTPSAVLPPLIISAFFLLVYEATLSDTAQQSFLQGSDYLAFILPLSLISASLSGAGIAGQNLVRDLENGYFDKLLLTPVSRIALLSGHVLAGAVILLLQAVLVVGIGLLMGLDPATGLPGLLVVLGIALLLGTGFSGFSVWVALKTGSAAATGGAQFAFFPFTFLTATFVPLELLSGWLETVARLNPITYLLDAMRSVLLTGWDLEAIGLGLLACAVLGIVPFMFALGALRARTARS